MANARETRVLTRLVDLASLMNYVLDRFNNVGEPLGKGQALIVPNISALTVYADGSVERDNSARNNPSPTELTLTVNQEPFIPVQLPAVSQIQNLAGNWDQQIASQVMIQLRNYLDSILLDYLCGSVAWTNTAVTLNGVTDNTAYQQNTAADSLTATDLLVARGTLLRQGGTFMQNIAWIMDPMATAGVMGFSSWQNQAINANEYGATSIGRVFGIEVIESQSLRTGKTFSTLTSATHASNVLTLVFSANPGLVVNGPIAVAGTTSSVVNAASLTVLTVSSDGLTVTSTLTRADIGATWQAGATVYDASTVNLLVDKSMIHTAIQKVPSIRVMPDPKTTGDILQASALLGYLARAGRVRAVRSPDAFI